MAKTKTQLANELRAIKNLLKSEKQARDPLAREFQALKNNVETIRAGVQSTADVEQRLADAQDQVRDLIGRLDTESKEHAISQMRLLKRAEAAEKAHPPPLVLKTRVQVDVAEDHRVVLDHHCAEVFAANSDRDDEPIATIRWGC